MMSYEVENTVLVRAISESETIDMIVPLPKRIVQIVDLYNNTGQFIIFSEELEELGEEIHDLRIAFTNDPKTPFAGALVNLGYFSLRMRLCNGKVDQMKSPFIFISENLNGLVHNENRPLRNPVSFEGEGKYFIDKQKLDSIQVLDYFFPSDLSQEHYLKYSYFDYEDEIGETFVRKCSFMSIYDRFEEFKCKELNSVDELYKVHDLKKK